MNDPRDQKAGIGHRRVRTFLKLVKNFVEQEIRIPSQLAENRKKIGQAATVENHIRKPTDIFTYSWSIC